MPKNDPGPTVKDKRLYKALRDEGKSKSKAARGECPMRTSVHAPAVESDLT